jgi:hypothetical protein
MASLINYKGLQVLDTVVGAGGEAISDNFRRIADSTPRSVWDKTADPTATDDGTETDPTSGGTQKNYQVGSYWLNTSSNKLFVCTDNTVSHAKWQLVPYHLLKTADGVNQPKLSADIDVNGHAITSSSNGPIVISPNGTGAIQMDTGGDARGEQAVDFQTARMLSSEVASGLRSFIAGGLSNTAQGYYSHAEGYGANASGLASHAEGEYTVSSAEASHAEGQNTYALGWGSHSEGRYSVANGDFTHSEGYNAQAADYASHSEGWDTIAQGRYSHSEGYATYALGDSSSAGGRNSKSLLPAQWARASGGFSNQIGTAQTTITQLFNRTTNATATELIFLGSPHFTIATNQTISCLINIVGRKESGGANDGASFIRQVCIRNTSGTVSLIGSVQTVGVDINPAGWGGVTITADTTTESLKIAVTGLALTNIRWMATVMASEVADAGI